MKSKLLYLSLLFLVSCTMHPKYERPETAQEEKWRFVVKEEGKGSNIGWWKELQDPVLDEYVELALQNNQEIKIAIARVDQFVAKLGVVRSELYPQIQADVGGNRFKLSETFAQNDNVPSLFDDYHLILKGSYELDVWGKIRSSSQAAYAEVLSQIQAQKVVLQTVIAQVVSTYINLRKFDEQLQVSKLTYKTRKESLTLATIRFRLGLTSQIQVDQALSVLEEAQADVEKYEKNIAIAEDLLATLLGETPREIKRGKSIDQLKLPECISVSIPSELISQRQDILQAEQMLISANANIGVAKAMFFPQISLSGVLGTQTSEFHSLFGKSSSVWDYGLSILQEVFTGGKLTNNLKKTEAIKREMLHNYQNTILNAFREVNDSLISHQKSLEIFKVERKRTYALGDYLHLANLRYNEGLTDYLTFLDAERHFFSANLTLIESRALMFNSLVELYQSLGGDWVDALDLQLESKQQKKK